MRLGQMRVQTREVAVAQFVFIVAQVILMAKQLLCQQAVARGECRICDEKVLGDFLVEVVEFLPAFGREVDAELDLLDDQFREVLVDDVARVFQLGEIRQLIDLLA